MTSSPKRGIKSLGPIRATDKEVSDYHYALYLTPTLELIVTFPFFISVDTGLNQVSK